MQTTLHVAASMIPAYRTQQQLLLEALEPLRQYLGITEQDLCLLALEVLLQHSGEAEDTLASLTQQGHEIQQLERDDRVVAAYPARSSFKGLQRGVCIRPLRNIADLLD